jgi:hypothetical protein
MKDKEVMRFDYIFSYWIFIWWILFELKLIKANPKFLLYIALPFSISVLILKLYPLYSLRHTQITQSDVYFSFLFFLIFLSWLSINGGVKEVYDFYSLSSASDGILPPFEYYFNKLFDVKC